MASEVPRRRWRSRAGAAVAGFLVTQPFDLAWQHATVAVSVTLVAALWLAPVSRPSGAGAAPP